MFPNGTQSPPIQNYAWHQCIYVRPARDSGCPAACRRGGPAADVVVAVVGITSDLEGEESAVDIPGFKGGDRTSLDLPKEEQELFEAVNTAGKPLIVVRMSGSALAVN
jgi:Glycosyl hydrolase family 3 C-terminal domain